MFLKVPHIFSIKYTEGMRLPSVTPTGHKTPGCIIDANWLSCSFFSLFTLFYSLSLPWSLCLVLYRLLNVQALSLSQRSSR